MNPDQIKNSVQAIIDGLSPLAEKMSVPLNKLFEWAVRENYVKVGQDILGIIVFSISLIIIYKITKWVFKKGDEYTTNFDEYDGFAVFFGLAVLIWGLISLFGIFLDIEDIIARVVNPEYHALIDIISKIHGN